MSWLDDFWNNINAGATTIATAPDPITSQPRSSPIIITPTAPETTKFYTLYGQVVPLTRSAVDYYLSIGVTPEPVKNEPKNTAFETLHPKQTQQLIKLGEDTTALGVKQIQLGDIVTRQDVTDISHQEQINQAHEHRQILETRSQKAIDERADIHSKLIQLGEHKHDGTSDGIDWYVKLGIVAVIGFIVYFILRKAIFK